MLFDIRSKSIALKTNENASEIFDEKIRKYSMMHSFKQSKHLWKQSAPLDSISCLSAMIRLRAASIYIFRTFRFWKQIRSTWSCNGYCANNSPISKAKMIYRLTQSSSSVPIASDYLEGAVAELFVLSR